jgi:acyl-coenzyme A synthetase/AMP-(fatty) acid ligase
VITVSDDFFPLIQRQPRDAFARISTNLDPLGNQTGLISVAEFLGQVYRLAAQLPAGKHLLNLCENRYLFTLAFCAALVKGQTTLLPQNRAEETQRHLVNEYPDTYILHDGLTRLLNDAPQINLLDLHLVGEPSVEIPFIAADFLAAVAFTSGSTGNPKANLKYWRTFVISTLMNGRAMLHPTEELVSVLATVPAQHMWGMETSVLMPLFWRLCMSDARPLFPQDICNSLNDLQAPRLLVTTPVHLRALVNSKIPMPQCNRVLCATAPLSIQLAQDTENLFKGDLLEVYGCSEIGSTAFRATANTESDFWTLIDGLEFTSTQNNDEIIHQINGKHLPAAQMLQDKMQIQDNQFRLLGRNEDIIDIAGKRGSLLEMNSILLSAPGVVDGIVFLPEAENTESILRPAALVVAKTENKSEIIAHFAKHLDPVFTPRPVLFVTQLPREENGKLRRVRLLEFYQNLRAANFQ